MTQQEVKKVLIKKVEKSNKSSYDVGKAFKNDKNPDFGPIQYRPRVLHES